MKLRLLKLSFVVIAFLFAVNVWAQDSYLDYFSKVEEAKLNPLYEKRIERKLKAAYKMVAERIPYIINNRFSWSESDPREHFVSFLGIDEPKIRVSDTGKLIFLGDAYWSNREIVVDVYAQYFRLLEYRDNRVIYVNLNYFDQGTLAKDNKTLFYQTTHFDYSGLSKAKYIDEVVINEYLEAYQKPKLPRKNCNKYF